MIVSSIHQRAYKSEERSPTPTKTQASTAGDELVKQAKPAPLNPHQLPVHLPRRTLGEIHNRQLEQTQPGSKKALPVVDLQKVKRDQEQKRYSTEAYRKAYTEVLKHANIYLHRLDDATSKEVYSLIEKVGATQQPFFTTQCTHIVTTQALAPVKASKPRQSILPEIPLSLNGTTNVLPAEDPIKRAQRLGIKVWAVNKFKKMAEVVLQGRDPSRPEFASPNQKHLTTLLREEKFFGLSTSRQDDDARHGRKLSYFTNAFVMIQDRTGVHKPILIHEFKIKDDVKDAPWPKLRRTAPGTSPYLKADDSAEQEAMRQLAFKRMLAKQNARESAIERSKQSEAQRQPVRFAPPDTERPKISSTIEEIKARVPFVHVPQKLQPNAPTLASGIAASVTSRAISQQSELMRPLVQGQGIQDKRLQLLEKRMTAGELGPKTPQQPEEDVNNAIAKKRKRVHPVRVIRPAKPGFCENCLVRYNDLDLHVRSKDHQRFVSNEKNYDYLDDVLEKVKRKDRIEIQITDTSSYDEELVSSGELSAAEEESWQSYTQDYTETNRQVLELSS